jgi:hypothetical protein
MKRIAGTRMIVEAPAPVVAMLEFKGKIFVATQKAVYVLRRNKLVPIEWLPAPTEEER